MGCVMGQMSNLLMLLLCCLPRLLHLHIIVTTIMITTITAIIPGIKCVSSYPIINPDSASASTFAHALDGGYGC